MADEVIRSGNSTNDAKLVRVAIKAARDKDECLQWHRPPGEDAERVEVWKVVAEYGEKLNDPEIVADALRRAQAHAQPEERIRISEELIRRFGNWSPQDEAAGSKAVSEHIQHRSYHTPYYARYDRARCCDSVREFIERVVFEAFTARQAAEYASGDFKASLDTCNEIIDRYSAVPDYYGYVVIEKGRCLAKLGRQEEAIAVWEGINNDSASPDVVFRKRSALGRGR